MRKWSATDPEVIAAAEQWDMSPAMIAAAWSWNAAASASVGWTP